ncbi:hypothetical protein [Alistipes onderdonkii]
MVEEIHLAREYGADGVVFGLLTPDGWRGGRDAHGAACP